MTTTVTVTTHSWPVKVTAHDKLADGTVTDTSKTVEPNSTGVEYVTSSRSLTFEELPIPAAAEPTSSEATDADVSTAEAAETGAA